MSAMSRSAFVIVFSILVYSTRFCTAQVRPIIDNGFLGTQFWATGIHPSGQFIVKADRSVIHAHDRRNKMLFQTFQAPCIVNTIDFSADGKLMYVNTTGEINEECNRALVYDFYTGKILYNETGTLIKTLGKSGAFYIKKREPVQGLEYLEVHNCSAPEKTYERRFYPKMDTSITMLVGNNGGYKELKGAYTPQDLKNGKISADSLPKKWNHATVRQDPLKYIHFDYQTEQETDSTVIGELNLSLIVDTFGFVDMEGLVLVYGIKSGRFIDSIPAGFFGYSYQEKTGKIYFSGNNALVSFDLAKAAVQVQTIDTYDPHYLLVENDSSYYEVSVREEKIRIRKRSGFKKPVYDHYEIDHPHQHYELFSNGRYYGTVLAGQKIIIHNKNKVIDLNDLSLEHVFTSPDTNLLHPAVAGIQPSDPGILKINGWIWDMHDARQFYPEEIPADRKIPLDAAFENDKQLVWTKDADQKHYFNTELVYDMKNISYPFGGEYEIFSEAKSIVNTNSIDVYKDDTAFYVVDRGPASPIAARAVPMNEKTLRAEEKKFRAHVENHFSPATLVSLNTFPDYTLFPFITDGKFPLRRIPHYNKKFHYEWFYAPVFRGDEAGYTQNKKEAENALVYNLFRPSLSYNAVTGQAWHNMSIINLHSIPQLDYAGIIPENDLYYSNFTFPVNAQLLLSMNYAYGIFSLEKTDGTPVVQSSLYRNGEFIHVTPDGYYFASKDKLSRISLRKGHSVYPIEQFDLKYNRPDIVLKRLGCTDQSMLESYHKAYLKRLKKMGFTEDMLGDDFHLPDLRIMNRHQLPNETDSASIRLNLEIKDEIYQLDRINVLVNNVPVFGTNGINLRDKKAHLLYQDIDLMLCEGTNKISVSVLNSAGAESYQSTLMVYKKPSGVKPDLYLVTIGDSKYKDSRYDLSFAAKDASDISQAFAANTTGIYGKVYNRTLTNEEVTRENVIALKEFLAGATINDAVMITVAGHGVLDSDFNYYLATHDMDFNDPAKAGLPYEELENLLDGIAPLRKTILIDACHSGEVDKEEVESLATAGNTTDRQITFRAAGAGIRKKNLGLKTTSELMGELFTDLRKGTGATVISSSAGVEYAMESAEWNNGLFTYCMLYGVKTMKADLNADGEIWLSELQKYLNKEVSELSKGRQRPTARIENMNMDFRLY